MKVYKKILAVILAVSMVINCNIISFANEYQNNIDSDIVLMKDAEQIAVFHIKNVMAYKKGSMWEEGVRICCRKAIFDINNEIAAYYFGLEDSNKNPAGYIVVGGNKNEIPIIEYSDEDNSFLNLGLEKTKDKAQDEYGIQVEENNSKIIYTGDMNYIAKHKMQDGEYIAYDISTSNFSVIDLNNVEEIHYSNVEDINNAWDFYNNTANSTPPDSGSEFITNPYNYEDGYDSSNYYTITNGVRYYNIMTDFADSAARVCAPTAATNLCKYWYLRNPSEYGNLLKGNSWNNAFDSLAEYMETSYYESGTSDDNVADAYRLYFDEVGFSCQAWLFSGTNNGRYIVNELNNDRPCHLIVHNHYMYGDHSVLAVGYAEYRYGNSYSTYIRIADGWTNYPSRYVWGACYGTWKYVVVIPD